MQSVLRMLCRSTGLFTGIILAGIFLVIPVSAAPDLPNIVIIYADDLGYGDLSVYNPDAAYKTPRLDRLANEGIRFTDGHSPCTVCSPSRYGLLTGNQPYRGDQGTNVIQGAEGPSLINDDELTIGDMLKTKGYRTGIFGKWHLGLTLYDSNGNPPGKQAAGIQSIDYERSTPLEDGPNNRGFDKSYITSGCPTTSWWYSYLVDGMVPVKPSFLVDNQSFPNYDGRWRADFRKGWTSEDFQFEGIDWVFLAEAKKFVKGHRQSTPDKPFFMVLSTQIAHAPVLPHPDLIGRTGDAGARGDFVFELDTIVGEVMDMLTELNIDENTLVLFSADNGAENFHVHWMREYHDHDPSSPWRGVKRDSWEGGHRVPFMARWPKVIPAGKVSDQPISQTDIMATVASIVGYDLPDDQAVDSYDMLPVLTGQQSESEPVRDVLLAQTWSNNFFILRQGPWKYIDGEGSGGMNYATNNYLQPYIIDDPTGAPAQLYNLEDDPGEENNLYYSHAEKRQELKALLDEAKSSGRSAPTDRTPVGMENIPLAIKKPESNPGRNPGRSENSSSQFYNVQGKRLGPDVTRGIYLTKDGSKKIHLKLETGN